MKTKISTTGKPNKARPGGFTLLELIVVIALMGIMLSFTMPRFQGSILTDDTKKVSRWLISKVQILKHSALKTRKRHTLHADVDTGQFWVTDETMSEEMREAASESGYTLPDHLEILDIQYPGGEKIASGQAHIRFYPGGYSDKVLIHMGNNDDNRTSLLVEPFLSKVKMYRKYVEFER